MHGTIQNLEKYIERVHDQQISDYEKLKRMAFDAALGVNAEIPKEI